MSEAVDPGRSAVSYAQNGEDVVLGRALAHVSDGRFVDVGAWHPVEDSVSRWFILRGWRGVHVEPVPELAQLLRAEYPDADIVQAVISDSGAPEAVLHRVVGTGLSSLSEEVAASSDERGYTRDSLVVPVMSLVDVAKRPDARDANGQTHFLKVDVEGAEGDVLRSADFSEWRPWILCVESMTPGRPGQSHRQWEPLLTAADYQFCLFDGVSRFYVASEHGELVDALDHPACVLDHFENQRVTAMRSELAATGAYATRLRDELRARDVYVQQLEGAVAAKDTFADQLREELAARGAYVDQLLEELAARGAYVDQLRDELVASGAYARRLESELGAAERLSAGDRDASRVDD